MTTELRQGAGGDLVLVVAASECAHEGGRGGDDDAVFGKGQARNLNSIRAAATAR